MLDFWIQTVSGRTFRVDRPDARDVDIGDIAHSLALQNRFNGHTRCPYSVAQHSVLVSRIVEQRMGLYPTPETPVNEPLLGLMHDAHEAYIGDLVSPVKKLLGDSWSGLERTCDVIIQLGFALKRNPNSLAVVKEADQIALATEVRDLIPGGRIVGGTNLPEPLHEHIVPLEWVEAKNLFLNRFWEFTGR
jgi:5'-deoxynucleotidase YfbR-like HD superfamily hydrolase